MYEFVDISVPKSSDFSGFVGGAGCGDLALAALDVGEGACNREFGSGDDWLRESACGCATDADDAADEVDDDATTPTPMGGECVRCMTLSAERSSGVESCLCTAGGCGLDEPTTTFDADARLRTIDDAGGGVAAVSGAIGDDAIVLKLLRATAGAAYRQTANQQCIIRYASFVDTWSSCGGRRRLVVRCVQFRRQIDEELLRATNRRLNGVL